MIISHVKSKSRSPAIKHKVSKQKAFKTQASKISCYFFINYPNFWPILVSVIMFWYYSSEVISRTFAPQCCDCVLDPLYLIYILEKTKHTWFPTQKNTSKTYITDSRNVLPSCARGKVNRFYHSHKNLTLSLSLSLSLLSLSLSLSYWLSAWLSTYLSTCLVS